MSVHDDTPDAAGRPLLLVAEFAGGQALTRAVERVQGLRDCRIDTFTPFPMPEVDSLLRPQESRVGLVALFGGLAGAAVLYGVQVYISVIDYPINVGGRPLHSWPAFLPTTITLTVLGAALAAFAGLLREARLPRYHHPVADAPGFARATQDRFFLCLEIDPARGDPDAAEAMLRDLEPVRLDRLPA